MNVPRWILPSFLAAGLAAQGDTPVPQPVEFDFRVPVHAAVDGDVGLWTAGPAYKAQFHDDAFVFFPWLGAKYPHNLPWRWKTDSVACGDIELMSGEASTVHEDWRVEFRRDHLIERYDVRAEGVEQSFVIAQQPTAGGDLTVTGSLATELRCAPTIGAAKRPLVFTDADGNPLVRYGEATVFDASGRQAPVTTEFDGERIQLRVAERWLRDAVFPITIDPLAQRWVVETDPAGFGRVVRTDVDHNGGSWVQSPKMFFYTREFSGSDCDAYGRMMISSIGSMLVFASLSSSQDVRSVAVTHSPTEQRWVFALSHYVASTGREQLLFYFHDFSLPTLNVGTTTGLLSTTADYSNVDISRFHDRALVFYEVQLVANPLNIDIFGRWLHADTQTVGAGVLVSGSLAGTTHRRRNPCVQPFALGGRAVVVWQEQNTVFVDDWDILASVFNETGWLHTDQVVDGSENGAGHAMRPKVDGSFSSALIPRYLVTYEQTPDTSTSAADQIRLARFDGVGAPSPNLVTQPSRHIANGSFIVNEALAVDRTTQSHWAAVYSEVNTPSVHRRVKVARIGNDGGVTENATVFSSLFNSATAPSITYNRHDDVFSLAYGTNSTAAAERYPLYSQIFYYPADAISVPYGHGCGPSPITSSQPYAGNAEFTIWLATSASAQPAALLLSFASANVLLDVIGMEGCKLNVDTGAAFIGSIPTTTGVFATMLRIDLPDVPLFVGDFYAQWIYANPAASTTLGLQSSEGLRVQVR